MKSLDIVNELIKEDNYKEEKVVYSFERVIDEDYLQQIKQDLEVLEIIITKSVDLEDLIYLFNKYENEDDYVLECYNDCHRCKLTLDELLRLKNG